MFKNVRSLPLRACIALASVLPVAAFADPADPFTDAVTNSTTKAVLYASALVGLSAATTVIMVGMKYVKKIRGAA